MKTNVKPTVRQAHWLSHLERARGLGLPLAQYCRARGLNVQSLYNARHELSGKPPRGVVRGAEVSGTPRKVVGKAGRFVAVEMSATPVRVSAPACRIQMRDVVIECADLPQAGWLLALTKGVADVVP